MSRKIFVYGDSHTRSLSQAQAKLSKPADDIEFNIRWAASDKPGVVRGDLHLAEALEIINGLGDKDVVAVSFLGTAHNVVGLLRHERPFLVMERNSTFDTTGYEIVPRQVIKDMFEVAYLRNKRIANIKSKVKGKFVHIMTPPPKEDNQFIKSKIKVYRGTVGETASIADPYARLRLWKLDMEILEEIGKDFQMLIVPPPIESIQDNGFLKPQYWDNDATHANSDYGMLVLEQLKNLEVDA